MSNTAQELLETWADGFTQVLEMMTGVKPTVRVEPAALSAPDASWSWWKHCFSLGSAYELAVGGDQESWVGLGAQCLGLTPAEGENTEEIRSTYQEVLNQCAGVVAQALTRRLGEEVSAGEVAPAQQPETGLSFRVAWGDNGCGLLLVFAPALLQAQPTQPPVSRSAPSPPPDPAEGMPTARPSKTMGLLMNVELPLSISFGRTRLPLRELLKLNTGSIVELNRAVGDLVEVVVNNCVIAQGEVVVVEGNYAVRIRQIVSKSERLALNSAVRTARAGVIQ